MDVALSAEHAAVTDDGDDVKSVDMEIYTEGTVLQLNRRLDPMDVVLSAQHAAVPDNEDDVKSVDM